MQLITVKTSEITPSQDYVKPDTIKIILKNWLHNNKQNLPPRPFIRRDESGNLIAIDGHNLLVIQDLYEGESEIFLVDGPRDTLTKEMSPESSQESIDDRNRELSKKFDTSLRIASSLREKDISSITDLRMSVPYLENTEKANKFLNQFRETSETMR